MRIGVVSDTHNHLPNTLRIVELFNRARVDRVVHTGDITQAKTLHALSGLRAPLYGVYGNNDLERESLEAASRALGHHLVDPPLRLCWAGREIVVVHDPLDLHPELLLRVDVAIHGHEWIGWFHLKPSIADERALEIGYRLRRAAWGRGLATEGSRALASFAVDELNPPWIDGCARPEAPERRSRGYWRRRPQAPQHASA